MRHFLLATGLIAGLTHPVFAFDTAECGEIESQIYTILDAEFGWEVTQSPTSTVEARPGACSVTDLEIYVQDLGVRYTARAASLLAPEAMDWVRGDVILPATVSLEILDVVIDTEFGVPDDLAWLVPVSADSISLHSSWDEATQALSLRSLRIDLGDGNFVGVALDGVAAGWQPYVLEAENFALLDLSVDIGFNGLFEQAIAPPIEANGNDLSPASMAFFAAMADGLLASAPQRVISPETRVEIVDFLRTLPTPRGTLALSLNNDQPFLPGRIFEDLRTGIPVDIAIPDRLTLTADWTPAN
ncbi:hypothetical protein [Gymnodinialimonas hymeniacidonis]|uniref:hypothetical protein n=1 Tax=Gymnodinialimonas hymeniacidonis TaxID=3126508 RepID=UPI0034C629AE